MHRHVYTQNLWAFLDVTFACIYCIYAIMRFHGWSTGQAVYGKQALDVLAMGAPVLIPRLAFNLLSDNLLFVGLRSMMADFTLLTVLAAWWACSSMRVAVAIRVLTTDPGVSSASYFL